VRLALGIAYRGQAYLGWQSQPGGRTVQDRLEAALSTFADRPLTCLCAGRTDTGVHGINQVVHVDSEVVRDDFSWVRGTNRYLPPDIAVQWCKPVPDDFHARNSAVGRRYAYVLLESAVRPAIEAGMAGWTFRPLSRESMEAAATLLVGEHDFSAFRSSECQAASPVKHLRSIGIRRHGAYWRFDFEANAFLHHMVRNVVGTLVYVGKGKHPPAWVKELLASKERSKAAPTFGPEGLSLEKVEYEAKWGLPQ
jgi:tRNA pseudouridine38-40 synthase